MSYTCTPGFQPVTVNIRTERARYTRASATCVQDDTDVCLADLQARLRDPDMLFAVNFVHHKHVYDGISSLVRGGVLPCRETPDGRNRHGGREPAYVNGVFNLRPVK